MRITTSFASEAPGCGRTKGSQNMKTLFRFTLASLLILLLNASARAQTPSASDMAAPAPAGQAPDQVMKKLSDLVHSGKYTEARQLTLGLLQAYPEDSRLIKIKALLDKSPAPANPATSDPSSAPAANNSSAQPSRGPIPIPLTGMDKVDYSALLELARQAQQTTD